jgi:phosphate starvation-inducible PhoH-like protein
MNKKVSERKSSTRRTPTPNTEEQPTSPKLKPPTTLTDIIKLGAGFKAKNTTQKYLANLIHSKEIILAAGPSGVGKSYVTVAVALELLKNTDNQFKRIVVSIPAVDADEKLGFLPGDVRQKMDPFIDSTMDNFDKIIGKPNRLILENLGYLLVQPIAYLRGKSIDNTIFIMEEAQNMTHGQMKTFLTRIGYNSKFIASGDLDQSDRFKDVKRSGLYDALKRHKDVEEIGIMEFTDDDIVRNKIISKILANYDKPEIISPNQPKLIIENKKSFFSKYF